MSAPAGSRTHGRVPRPRLGSRALSVRVPRVASAAAACLFYLAFAVFLTWPMASDPGDIYYGGGGDPLGTMATYRELVEGRHNPFLPGRIAEFSAPEGQPIAWVRNLASAPGVLSLLVLTWAFGAMAAVGVYTLLGYTLSGLVMFLLARRLTASTWAALLAGWAFAFYPFAVVSGQGHYDMLHGWVLVLAIWRLLELGWEPTRRNGLLAGAAVALAMWWTPYWILIGGMAYAVLALGTLALAARRRELRRHLLPQALAALVVALFAAGLGALVLADEPAGSGVRANTIQDLNNYSARPLEYVVPPATNPWVGPWTGPFLLERIHGSNPSESTLYVGLSVLALALVGIVAALRGRLDPRLRASALLIALMTLVAGLSSAPPEGTVAGVTVPFPSHFIAQVTSTWRVYSRFVVLVMIGLALLLAVGAVVLARSRTGRTRIALCALVSVIVPVDLWARLPLGTNRDGSPPVYEQLARTPGDGIVAEYPLIPNGQGTYGDIYYQHIYDKPILSGYLQGTLNEQRAVSLANLADPATAPRLERLGVDHVVVRRELPGYNQFPPGRPGRDFERLYGDDYAALYRVAPRPGAHGAGLEAGFGAREGEPKQPFQWLMEPTGRIELVGDCRPCVGTVTMVVDSFARPRVATVRDRRGRVLIRQRISGPTTLRLPVRFDEQAFLSISATPGAESVGAALRNNDPRRVSLSVEKLRLRLREPRR